MNTFKRLILFLSVIGLLGGCSMTSKEVTLTKEQQDNVTKRILLTYDVEQIEFLSFVQNSKTGFYYLNIRINDDDALETTISFDKLDNLQNDTDQIGLNPIDKFKQFESNDKSSAILSNKFREIDIHYLEK